MAETKTGTTAEELIAMPDDGVRREVVKGELREVPLADASHGDVAMNLGALLKNHVKANDLGRVPAAETGFIITRNPDTTRAPDTGFISKERIPTEGVPDGYWELAPDLAVEVVSPNDTATEVQEKIREWIEAGVRLVWVVYPKTKSVVVHKSLKDIETFTEEETLTGEGVLPGFECVVKEIFE
ncbi:MAG: Uma2 family endonuclease [Rubrobacter sp.]|jgi:Uma2 family endonuclease|nr:Uma2 family endonuclease [Rubrobacter sp.]